jgi:Na+/proline symporter
VSTLTIILTIVGYVAMLFVVAWRSSRRADNATFFTGGRSTHRAVAAVAMVGAAMSGVTYISVPGTVLADSIIRRNTLFTQLRKIIQIRLFFAHNDSVFY